MYHGKLDFFGHVDKGPSFHQDERYFELVATLEPHKAYSREEPSFSMDKDAAQQLMDSLWTAGIRPSQSASGPHKNEMDATLRHLDDMRHLVFKGKGPE
jgi:hypothetical protein